MADSGDTLKKSSTEQILQMVAGYFIGVGLNYLVLPHVGVTQPTALWGVSLIFTVVSYFRGLFIRRVFNRLPHNWSFTSLLRK